MANKLFSNELHDWLKSDQTKTFGTLEKIFQEKSFAVAFLILMVPAALPLPTGGVTHVLEVITMLLALELVAGRRRIWIPKSWRRRNLGKTLEKKTLPKLVGFIKWFERHSHKRLAGLIDDVWYLRLAGLAVFFFALAAALAIPFSGLDTLPALAIVLISLSLILEDAVIMIYAFAIGLIGVVLEISLGSVAIHFLH